MQKKPQLCLNKVLKNVYALTEHSITILKNYA